MTVYPLTVIFESHGKENQRIKTIFGNELVVNVLQDFWALSNMTALFTAPF